MITKFKVGDTVRLSRSVATPAHVGGNDPILPTVYRTAKIEMLYKDIPGGVRLNRPLAGFVSWNINDLVLITDRAAAGARSQPSTHVQPGMENTKRMAKQIKNKYLVTVPVVELVPEGAKPMKLKDVKAAVAVAVQALNNERLAAGKVKVEAV